MKDNAKRRGGVTGALVILAVLGGCGGGGESSASPSLDGNVIKGAIVNASVVLYTLNSDGSKGTVLGTASTDGTGNFTIPFTKAPTTAVLAVSSGGSYVDEVTGTSVLLSASDQLTAVIPAGTTHATINPATHMAASRALALAQAGTPLDTAISSSNAGIAQQFGLTGIFSSRPVAADDSNSDVKTAPREGRRYGLIMAGIAQLANTLNVPTMDLVRALANDISDGVFDGKKNGVAVTVQPISGPAITLSASAATTDLQTALNSFIASARNKTGFLAVKIPLTPAPVGINVAGLMYITSTALPAWVGGQSGSFTLTAAGGTPPYKCALKSGSTLPNWLTLSNSCVLSGTPPALPSIILMHISNGFTVVVTDSAAPPASSELELYATIVPVPPKMNDVAKTVACCPSDSISEPLGLAPSGGVAPYYFTSGSFYGGAPPLGTIVDLYGKLIGTCPKPGGYSFLVLAVDAAASSISSTVTLTVKEPASGCSSTGSSNLGTWNGTYTLTVDISTDNCCNTPQLTDSGTITMNLSKDAIGLITGTASMTNLRCVVSTQYNPVSQCSNCTLGSMPSFSGPITEGFLGLAGQNSIHLHLEISDTNNSPCLTGAVKFLNFDGTLNGSSMSGTITIDATGTFSVTKQ